MKCYSEVILTFYYISNTWYRMKIASHFMQNIVIDDIFVYDYTGGYSEYDHNVEFTNWDGCDSWSKRELDRKHKRNNLI